MNGKDIFFFSALVTDAQDAFRSVPSGSPKKKVVRARCDGMHHRARSDSPNSFNPPNSRYKVLGSSR